MAKYHITKKGEAGLCTAAAGNCPLGSADNHFKTPEEATAAFEKSMEGSVLAPAAKKRPLKELNELAKTTTEASVIEEVLARGSHRTFANLAKNPAAGMHHLVRAYNATEDPKVRSALTKHPHFPVGRMSGSEFVEALQERYKKNYEAGIELAKDPGVGDEHAHALARAMPKNVVVNHVLSNPSNRVSQTMAVELATNFNLVGAAMRSGKFPPELVPQLEPDLVYWGNVAESKDPRMLDGYATWAVEKRRSGTNRVESVAREVAVNKHTSPETLHRLAEANLAVEEVYRHPSASEETRKLIRGGSEEVQRQEKLAALQAELGVSDLKGYLLTSSSTVQPYAHRGLRDSSFHFDREKLQAHGLTREDLVTLLGRGKYSWMSYDEATGVVKATEDSTD